MQSITQVPTPINEPVHTYAPGSPERSRLQSELTSQGSSPVELTQTIGGTQSMPTGSPFDVVQPHDHHAVLGTAATSTHADAQAAVAAAAQASPEWAGLSYDDRAAVFLRAADLLSGPWRERVAAATMLGQSKTAVQAEIDAPCELIDFWRFNVAYGRRVLEEQPISSPGVWNQMDHRPLEGFIYAITPFNFSAIAGNLPTAPALMGNTVIWKPSPTQTLAAWWTMRLLEAAGLPPGVINMVTGDGIDVSDVLLSEPTLAGIHFTGSTPTFQHLWQTVGSQISTYNTYPRLVGETGGKDFVLAHPSADPATLITALVRGAFEYQGQKCSAASRAFVARSVWESVKDELVDTVENLTYGNVTDLTNFGGALIDARAYAKLDAALGRIHVTEGLTVLAGGTCDDSTGWFVRPTLVEGTDPTDEVFSQEYFGPILAVHVYEDSQWSEVLDLVDQGSRYALTGAVIATDRHAIEQARARLRNAAGNFYINDRPTGAVVGQQPFGGARASGTNDKAGSILNLQRWTSPRSVKETLVPPTDHRYPHQEPARTETGGSA